MFGKLKKYATKKVLQSQLKDAPPEQQAMIMEMMEKNPELFEQMAKEIQAEMKANGNNQMAAAMKVMPKYQQQILATMSPETREKMMQMQGGGAGASFNADGSIHK